MLALIPLGPLVGTIGWVYGAEHSAMLGGIMLFSAGGILYLIFQDVAPQSRLERHWGPALGAVLGFGVGMLGQMLVSGD
jgi:ZIP family zinc transporter